MIGFTTVFGWNFRGISMSSPVVVLKRKVKQRAAKQISEIMRRVPSRDTQPELVLIRALRKAGFSFKTQASNLPGKPDIVFPLMKLAIFVDGDLWHGNQWKLRGFRSLAAQFKGVNHRKYWIPKILRNVTRDFRNTARLLDSCWKVLRFWESDVLRNLEGCVRVIDTAVQSKSGAEGKVAFSELARLSFAEFFAGIGLVRFALERHNWQVLFANDIDKEKFKMYDDNFDGAHFQLGDIHKLSPDEIPPCALYTASFPCNDLSLAGARGGLNGKQSGAFWGLIQLLRGARQRPPLILLENVPGFLTSGGGVDFENALVALNEMGYVCDAFFQDARRFVPQSRVRLFVVGVQGIPAEAVQGLTPSAIRPESLVDFVLSHPHIQWRIRPLPEARQTRKTLQSILEDLPENDPNWWNRERAEYFMNQLSPKHLAIARKMIASRQYSYGTAFRRIRKGRSMAELRVDGIAGCLRTPRGGSGRQILFKAGNGKYWVRLLTARECARLQGIPDDKFKIEVPLNQALFGFGDAVCVPVIEWIAANYLTPIAAELLRSRLMLPTNPDAQVEISDARDECRESRDEVAQIM
jgi:DNA (cytosine-5)-methyltransferase 1